APRSSSAPRICCAITVHGGPQRVSRKVTIVTCPRRAASDVLCPVWSRSVRTGAGKPLGSAAPAKPPAPVLTAEVDAVRELAEPQPVGQTARRSATIRQPARFFCGRAIIAARVRDTLRGGGLKGAILFEVHQS